MPDFRFLTLRVLKHSIYRDFIERRRELSTTSSVVLSTRYLDQLLTHCHDRVEYYRSVSPRSLSLVDWPTLTKELIRANRDRLLGSTQAKTYENSSGGSTGHPLTLVQDEEYRRWTARVKEYYFREFLGVEWLQVRSVWLWGSDRDLRRRSWRSRISLFLRPRLILNTFHTSETIWLDYIDRINSYRPYFVAGYAGSLYRLAEVAKKHRRILHRPQFVHSSAELLHGYMRDLIEDQFKANVYDYYGSREVGAIAGSCRFGRLHVFSMNNILEVVDQSGRSVPRGNEGEIAVTNLHNYSMPLVRYLIGDTGVLGSSECPCGSRLPVLEKLTGRTTDHFRTRANRLVHGEYFTHLFYHRPWVNQFQVDQLDFEHIRVYVVPNSATNQEDVVLITRKIREAMGNSCRVSWEYVDSISRTSEGKHVYTRCLLDR